MNGCVIEDNKWICTRNGRCVLWSRLIICSFAIFTVFDLVQSWLLFEEISNLFSITLSTKTTATYVASYCNIIHIRQSINHHFIPHHPSSIMFSNLSFILACILIQTAISDPNYWDTLGLRRGSSSRDIKKAFRKLASKWHPDKNPGDQDAHDKFVQINRAYEVLSDEDKRRVYNQYGEEGLKEHEKNQAAKVCTLSLSKTH